MNVFGRIVIGCLLLTSMYIPIIGKGQPVLVSGKGQLKTRPSDSFNGGILEYYNFLPQYKARAKSVTITTYDLWSDFGEMKRHRGDGYTHGTKIIYDRKGNIETVLSTSSGIHCVSMISLLYEKQRIAEIIVSTIDADKVLNEVAEKMAEPSLFLAKFPGEQVLFKRKTGISSGSIKNDDNSFVFNILDIHDILDSISIENCVTRRRILFRYKYDSNGLLESAMGRPGGQAWYSAYYVKYKLDGRGNITDMDEFEDANKIQSHHWIFQYDVNNRMIAHQTSFSDYHWNYDKFGHLDSYRRIDYSYSSGKRGAKTYEHEYQFEYGEDGNPLRCVHYKHGDLSIIEGGSEYEYVYTFYLTPEEQRTQDSIQRQAELIIAQENQRQAKLQEILLPFRFLFDSEEAFVSCVSSNLDVAEKEITQLIIKRMQYVSSVVISGKELQDTNHAGKKELLQICDMCIIMKGKMSQYKGTEKEFVERIFNFSENILGDFVSGRSILKRAYKKSPNSDYSVFLSAFIKTNNTNVNRVSNSDSENPVLFVIGGLLGALGVTGIAYLLSLIRQ